MAKYTKQEGREISLMTKQGYSSEHIAAALGRTKSAIVQKKYRMRVERQHDAAPKIKGGAHAKRVLCIETGEVWESYDAAAEAIGCSDSTIGNKIRSGLPVYDRKCKERHLINA